MAYQSFKARRESVVPVSPYLLKEYRNRWFLLCSPHDRLSDVRIMAVDRMLAVEPDTKRAFQPNPQFDPEHFFDNVVGVTKTLGQPSETVVLWLSAAEAPYALTKPLHASQHVRERRPDGSVVVTLQVVVNFELERLILGHADRIEVLAPRLLRHRIARACQMAALRYVQPNAEDPV